MDPEPYSEYGSGLPKVKYNKLEAEGVRLIKKIPHSETDFRGQYFLIVLQKMFTFNENCFPLKLFKQIFLKFFHHNLRSLSRSGFKVNVFGFTTLFPTVQIGGSF